MSNFCVKICGGTKHFDLFSANLEAFLICLIFQVVTRYGQCFLFIINQLREEFEGRQKPNPEKGHYLL